MSVALKVLIGVAIFFALPSTMCVAVFLGIFRRKKTEAPDYPAISRHNPRILKRYEDALAQMRALPSRRVAIRSHDGKRLCADYYDQGGERTAILAHGYRSTPLANCLLQAVSFWDRGYNLLLIYERAHGPSEGAFTTMGYQEQFDLRAWIDWVDATPAKQIVVYGVSMACTALGLASGDITSPKVSALVLDCGFVSFTDQMAYACSRVRIPVGALIRGVSLVQKIVTKSDMTASTLDSLRRNHIPTFFLHGEADPEVPVSEMTRNLEACAAPKDWAVVPGAEHAVAFAFGGDEIETRLHDFIDRYGKD